MTLNKSSWYYKLYTKTYSSRPPNNLCGFFWKLVWAILWFPINFIWNIIPETVDKLIDKDGVDNVMREPYFSVKPIVSAIIYFGVFAICCIPVAFFYPWFSNELPFMAVFGQSTCTFGALAIIFFGIRWIVLKVTNNKKHSSNLLIEYIKAKKAKLCPRIEWK